MAASKNFSRRSLLQGLGAGTVLLSGLSRTALAAGAPAQRYITLFHANGSHPSWTPTGTDANFVLSPHLAPLEAVRSEVLILRNLTMQRGDGNPHKAATFSTLAAGGQTSIDQTLAQAVKGGTPLSSLELAIGFTTGE